MEGRIRKEKTIINNKQYEAWLHAIKNNQCNNMQHWKNVRLCLKHFHPSVLQYNNSKNSISLKIRASPTLYLTPFSQNNSNYKENKLLLRSVATPEIIDLIQKWDKSKSLLNTVEFLSKPLINNQLEISSYINKNSYPTICLPCAPLEECDLK